MGDDFVARPRGTVAKDDDFAVQEFDTGRGAGPRRPQAEVAPNRPVIERQWERICWGTEGSNPAPSSGESTADLASAPRAPGKAPAGTCSSSVSAVRWQFGRKRESSVAPT